MQDYTEDLLELASMDDCVDMDGDVDSDSGDLTVCVDDYLGW